MEKSKPTHHVTRRDALKTIAVGMSTVATLPVLTGEATGMGLEPLPPAPAPVGKEFAQTTFFTEHQYKTVEVLTELLIPADEQSPGAKEAKVADYIHLMVGAGPEELQKLWSDGLAELDTLSQQRWANPFIALTPEQQVSILLEISQNEAEPQTRLEKFFRDLKKQTIIGYYTSKIGIHQELQYKGNIYLAEFQGCTHPEHQA